MRRVIISKTGGVLTGNAGTGYKAPNRATMTVATPASDSFREFNDDNRMRRSEPRSCLAIAQSRAIYGRPIDAAARARAEKREARELAKARERAANLARVKSVAPITNEEALELIRKHQELEARLIAEERAEEQTEAKAKRTEYVRRRQSALAGLNKTG